MSPSLVSIDVIRTSFNIQNFMMRHAQRINEDLIGDSRMFPRGGYMDIPALRLPKGPCGQRYCNFYFISTLGSFVLKEFAVEDVAS